MSRTYYVKLNLDEMCADLDTLTPDQHAEWLAGFRAGSRGRVPEGWAGPRRQGADFGMRCFHEAEAFRATKVAGGKARQASVRAASGEHMLTPCSAPAQHDPQPSNNEQPVSNNQNSTARVAAASSVAPDPFANHPMPPPLPAGEDWFVWRQKHPRLYIGGSGEDGNLQAWQSLFRRCGPEILTVMYQRLAKTIPENKRIGYSAALAWVDANTMETP